MWSLNIQLQKECLPAEEAQAFFLDASWTPPWGVVMGMPHQEETPGKSQDMLEGLKDTGTNKTKNKWSAC